MSIPGVTNRLREERLRRGWSQDDLAERAAISRAGVSAIEIGRLVPSAAAALALAAAFGCRVEDLFRLESSTPQDAEWVWPPVREPCRYWLASVAGRRLRYPVEPSPLGAIEHDGVFRDGQCFATTEVDPERTIVLACCDPAVGLLAREVQRTSELRLIVLPRSSRAALDLLRQGLVHAAGVHLGKAGDAFGNATAASQALGCGFQLIRVARWEEGLATAPARHVRSATAALRADLKWVGREPGSGARQCLDELLRNRKPPKHLAADHRGVAEAIRFGWADAGVCVRLSSEEAGLDFISLREEAYDLCTRADSADPRLRALGDAIRSVRYRNVLAGLPGYDARDTGQTQLVS